MFFYAQINASNVVVAVSQLADSITDPSLISIPSYDESLLGKIWDGTKFNPPPAPPPAPPSTIISKIAFIHLFTDAELFSILTAAKTDVVVELLITKTKLSDCIDLTDTVLINALTYLTQQNLLATGRSAQILANTPPA